MCVEEDCDIMKFMTIFLYFGLLILPWTIMINADDTGDHIDYSDTFKVTPCGGLDDPVKLKNVIAMPDPIVTPGSMILTLAVEVTKTLYAPIKFDMLTQRKVGDRWMTLPCVYQFLGSCKYDDLCALFRRTPPCPREIEKRIPCKCPVDVNTYKLYGMELPSGPEGKYHTRIEADSWMLGRLMCYEIDYEIVNAP